MIRARGRAACRALVVALCLAAPTAALADPIVLPAPAWRAPVGAVPTGPASPRLEVIRSRANAIVDVEAWFRRNRLRPEEWAVGGAPPGAAPLPATIRRTYDGAPLVRAIRAGRVALLLYGEDLSGGRWVVGVDVRTGAERFAYDFARFAFAPGTPRAERPFARQDVLWAALAGDTLLVETAHATYARSSGRRNAYVTAVDLATSRVRWRSPALVANAGTFAVVGDLVLTGYGFTAESDALYALDRRTGRPLRRLAVPSAPEQLRFRRGVLFVRTYDRDLVVRVVPGR